MSFARFIAWTPLLADGGGILMPLIVVLFIVISAVRAMIQARRAKAEHEAGGGETESERRAREIRERLRRVIEERRGLAEPGAPSPPEPEPAPRALPGRVPPLDPFAGPLRRILEELAPPVASRPAEPPVVAPRRPEPALRPDMAAPRAADRRDLQPEGPVASPAGSASLQKAATSARSMRGPAVRDRLWGDLGDRDGLRRAFVLREVLGPPVSLRR